MGNASVGSTDLADLMRVPATKLSEFEDQGQFSGSPIRSDYCFEDIIGNRFFLHGVLDQVAIVAATNVTVLLHGETETGKEPNSGDAQGHVQASPQFGLHELRCYPLGVATYWFKTSILDVL
jgi:hypothetical protein